METAGFHMKIGKPPTKLRLITINKIRKLAFKCDEGAQMTGERRPRKPRWPINPGNCLAYQEPVHPADPAKFTGYCLKHEDEYQKYRLRYNNWTYNFNHGRTSKRPPSKESYFQSVSFSPLAIPYRSISIATLNHIGKLLETLREKTEKIENQREELSRMVRQYPEHVSNLVELLDYSKKMTRDITSQLEIRQTRKSINYSDEYE
jgi:hypothetical protein